MKNRKRTEDAITIKEGIVTFNVNAYRDTYMTWGVKFVFDQDLPPDLKFKIIKKHQEIGLKMNLRDSTKEVKIPLSEI